MVRKGSSVRVRFRASLAGPRVSPSAGEGPRPGSAFRALERVHRRVGEGRPDEIPASEVVMLHDAEAQKALVVLFFDNEGGLQQGRRDPDGDAARRDAGQRRSFGKYGV